jgi:DNA-binding MarR family transcriptional regulator
MADKDFSRLLAKWKTLYAIFADDSVTPSGRHVVLVLMDYHRRLGCFPGYDRLLKATGYSRKGLKKAIKSLESAGWVVVHRSGNGRQSNRYAPAYGRGEREYARLKHNENEQPPAEVGMPADETGWEAPAEEHEGGYSGAPGGGTHVPQGGERTYPRGGNARTPESTPIESPQVESSPPSPARERAREEEDPHQVEVYGPEWESLTTRIATAGSYEKRHGGEGSGLAREDVEELCRALGQQTAWKRLTGMLDSGMFGGVLEDRIREAASNQPRPKGAMGALASLYRERHANPLRAAGEQPGGCPFETMESVAPAQRELRTFGQIDGDAAKPSKWGLEDTQWLQGELRVMPAQAYRDQWLATHRIGGDVDELRRVLKHYADQGLRGTSLIAAVHYETGLRAAPPEQDINRLAAG